MIGLGLMFVMDVGFPIGLGMILVMDAGLGDWFGVDACEEYRVGRQA